MPPTASSNTGTVLQREVWRSISLAEKIPENIRKRDPALLQRTIARMAQGLKVEWKSSVDHGWLSIATKGDDAEAFESLLKKELGQSPVQLSGVEKWDVWKGFITGAGQVGYGVYVDLGIRKPRPKDALYPLHRMRAQLADGKPEPAKQILTVNALTDYLPVKVTVTEIDQDKVTVELADETLERMMSWQKYPFDRIILVGLTNAEAESLVRQMRLSTDIIEVGRLSLFVQQYVLKIGTQAPGIIAKIGGRLRGISLTAYHSSKKLDWD